MGLFRTIYAGVVGIDSSVTLPLGFSRVQIKDQLVVYRPAKSLKDDAFSIDRDKIIAWWNRRFLSAKRTALVDFAREHQAQICFFSRMISTIDAHITCNDTILLIVPAIR